MKLLSLAFFNDHVTVLELTWLALGIIFFYLSINNVRDAHRDLKALDVTRRNGLLRDVAVHGQIMEITRLLISFAGVLAGIAAMATPPINPGRPINPLQIIVTVAMFLVFTGVGVQIVKSREMRKRLLAEARSQTQD